MFLHALNCMPFTLAGVPNVTLSWLIDTHDGLALVDSGLGLNDYAHPTRRMRFFCTINRVANNPSQTAIHQIEGLGYDPRQVRHIVLTHMHLDHAGGIGDFPWASVHVLAAEHANAMQPKDWIERFGYAPEAWAHGPDWRLHTLEGQSWFGLEATPVLPDESIWLVPLPGHSRGHCGVAVQTRENWLLHCGDAFLRGFQVDLVSPRSPFPTWSRPLIGSLERRMLPAETIRKIQALVRQYRSQVQVFCSHDNEAFTHLKNNFAD